MGLRANENRIFNDVNTAIQTFPDGYKVRHYHGRLRVREKGWEEETSVTKKKHTTKKRTPENCEEKSRVDHIQRTKSQIMDLVRCNKSDWKSFVTLTFKDNVTDLTAANKTFHAWTKSVRRAFPDFKYLGVPELQERGAWHYHLFTNLVPGSDLCPLQEGKKKMYDVKYWTAGFSSVFDLDCTDKNFRVDLYICKYMMKDYERAVLYGRKRIMRSNNLAAPQKNLLLLDDEEYAEMLKNLSKDAKEIKEKTVVSANNYCPNFSIVDIISAN